MAPTIFPLARLVADKRARPNTRRRPTKHNTTQKGGHHKNFLRQCQNKKKNGQTPKNFDKKIFFFYEFFLPIFLTRQ
jgi:hypothetical protein